MANDPKYKKGVVLQPCRIREKEGEENENRAIGDIIETTETHLRELIGSNRVEEYNGSAKPGDNIKAELDKKAEEAKKASAKEK